jgi:hypothetical protein
LNGSATRAEESKEETAGIEPSHATGPPFLHRASTQRVLLSALTIVLLLPFLNKAYHIDDTLFLKLAEQIRTDPLAPYETDYIWFFEPEPYWKVTQNPPLNGYVLAGVTSLLGETEWKLHLVYLGFAVGCTLFMHSLATRFCAHPVLVTLLCVISPAFLVSSSSVMADVPLYFFWLAAVWAAVRYVDSGNTRAIWLAGLFVTAAAMTKYFGVALVPLLVVYCASRLRRSPGHFGALLLPVLVLAVWGAYSQAKSGSFHPLGAATYSIEQKDEIDVNLFRSTGQALSFLGGTLFWPILLLPLAVRWPRWLAACAYGTLVGAVALEAASIENVPTLTYWLFTLSGGFVLVSGALGWKARPDWESTLLGLWLYGTFAFCAFFNWTVNTRVILPALLPAALMTFRWLESIPKPELWFKWIRLALIPMAAVSLLVGAVDQYYANTSREFVQAEVGPLIESGQRVYFSGHWGFQYYMEHAGAVPYNFRRQRLDPDDLIAFPYNNCNVELPGLGMQPPIAMEEQVGKKYPNPFGMHTMSNRSRTGFYSSLLGPVPFGIAKQPFIDRFNVFRFAPEQNDQPREPRVISNERLFRNK